MYPALAKNEAPPQPTFSLILTRVLVAIALAVQIFVAWRFWATTWDDSAITLGFARTFALTGRIEPTPGSGIVEGYSTTLWMLLMAVAAKLVVSPLIVLAVAKISTLLLNLANILLIRRWLRTWTTEILANLVAGSMGCCMMFFETINGMETPLVLTLVLVMLLLYPLRTRASKVGYLLSGCALLLTRWEAIILLIPFVIIDRFSKSARLSIATWLTVFIVSNIARWKYFGSLVPNTIIAKRGAPYISTSRLAEIQRHLHEPLLLIYSCKEFLLVVVLCLLYNHLANKQHSSLQKLRTQIHDSWQLRFTLVFSCVSIILTTGIGENWGPPLRSFYSAWPFLLCLLFLPITSNLQSRALPWATIALCFVALLRMSTRIHQLDTRRPPAYMPGATVSDIASIGDKLFVIQTASHHNTLLVAAPDMGGVMLFHPSIRLIDLGLLCDPVLARQRYAAIGSYVLDQRHPDVIEIHSIWTNYTAFNVYPEFLSNYRPVFVDGRRFFLSRDLIKQIEPASLTEKSFSPTGIAPDDQVPDLGPSDYALNRKFGTYVVLTSKTGSSR